MEDLIGYEFECTLWDPLLLDVPDTWVMRALLAQVERRGHVT